MVEESNLRNYTFLDDLVGLIAEIPTNSIMSRTIYKDTHLKAVLFGFAAGQALSEHSAANPATIHILSGKATITLGDDTFEAESGAWAYLPPLLLHSITAKTSVTMLLMLLNPGFGETSDR